MPVYEFKCSECGEIYSEIRSVGDYNTSTCPKCNSNKTDKIFSLFSGNKSNQPCASTSGG